MKLVENINVLLKEDILKFLYEDEVKNVLIIHPFENEEEALGDVYIGYDDTAIDAVVHAKEDGNSYFTTYVCRPESLNKVIEVLGLIDHPNLMVGGQKGDVEEMMTALESKGEVRADGYYLWEKKTLKRVKEVSLIPSKEEHRHEIEKMMIGFFEARTDEAKEAIKSKLKLERLYVLMKDDQLIGMGRFFGYSQNFIDLTAVYIKPSERLKGHGKQLMILMIDEAIKLGKCPVLQTSDENTHAIKIYESLGFKKIQEYAFQFLNLNKIHMIKSEHTTFMSYYKIYHGYKHSNDYFRPSHDDLLSKVSYINSSYLFYQNDQVIGGVMVKANFLADLFVVEPYTDVYKLAKISSKELVRQSDDSKPITIQELTEDYVEYFIPLGYEITQSGYWMIARNNNFIANLHQDYLSREVQVEDVSEIADLMVTAYTANKSFYKVDTLEEYQKHVTYYIEKWQSFDALNNASQVIVDKKSEKIIGMCLHMMFEELPLLMSLAVHPAHQGKGIGNYLVQSSLIYLEKDYEAVRLYVYKNNPALKLYEKNGYIKSKTLNDMVYKRGPYDNHTDRSK